MNDKTYAKFTRKKDGRIIVNNKGNYVGTWTPNKTKPVFTEKFIIIRRISPLSNMQYRHKIGRYDLKYYKWTANDTASGECVLGDKRPKKKI